MNSTKHIVFALLASIGLLAYEGHACQPPQDQPNNKEQSVKNDENKCADIKCGLKEKTVKAKPERTAAVDPYQPVGAAVAAPDEPIAKEIEADNAPRLTVQKEKAPSQQLQRLDKLRLEGRITDEKYQQERNKLLDDL